MKLDASTRRQLKARIPALPPWSGRLTFSVIGDPVPKGSVRAVAPGVVIPDNPALKGWAALVRLEAQRAMGRL